MSDIKKETASRGRRARRWIKVAGLPVAAALTLLVGTAPAQAVTSNFDFSVHTADWSCGHEVWTATAELKFQCDGNLVIYNFSGHALWATGTYGSHQATRVDFSASGGDIELYNSGNSRICRIGAWDIFGRTEALGGYASMQDDGNFVIYSSTNHAVWSSETYQGRQGTVHQCY